MGFVEIENMGKKALEQFPAIKHAAKRVYQLASVATSNEKFKSEGDVVRVSPDDGYEYFYGYYDKSPWDATDRYMICIKVKQAYKSVAPKELGVVGVIDTQDQNKFIKIGVTHSWNVQQSCMAQWMGPDFETKIIYNDFRDGKYCSVIYNWAEKHDCHCLFMMWREMEVLHCLWTFLACIGCVLAMAILICRKRQKGNSVLINRVSGKWIFLAEKSQSFSNIQLWLHLSRMSPCKEQNIRLII